MNVKKSKKNLSLNKRTVWNLDINHDDVLRKNELKAVNSGSEPIFQVGTTLHPKYC
jgi:hypothetical protein